MSAPVRAGDRFDDRFDVEALRGRGGAGAVYRAFDRERGERVALKILAENADVARFDAEARALESIDHPGIVRSLAHGASAGGTHWIALEWIEGITLSERLSEGRLAVGETLAFARRLFEALAAAHASGVVHRDLSPRNVLLPGGALEHAKIVDFGLAHHIADLMTGAGSGIVGTPGYTAPEQARAEDDVDARADVFAAGCLIHECLAGRPAFEAAHAMAMLAKIVFDDVPRLDRLRDDVPPALASLVQRSLAKAREDRPRDGAALLALLDDPSLAEAVLPARAHAGEQRLVAIVMARASGDLRASVQALRRAPEAAALALDVLANGTIIGTATSSGSATDLARGAVRGALAMRDALEGAHIAVALGRARLEGASAGGEAIDRAAAMLRAAGSRETAIRIDEITRELLDDRFEVRVVDGLAQLVAYSASASGVLLGRSTPFVGRARELDTLIGLLEDSAEEERAIRALVTGPAGAGKSRLRRELVRHAAGGARVLLGRGDALRAGSSFALVQELLREAFELYGLEPLEARAAIFEALREGLGDEARSCALFLAEVLALPGAPEDDVELRAARDDPRLMHDRVRGAFLAWLELECRRGPVLLVLEDLHWGDEPSARLVGEALARLRDRALALVAFARPEVGELAGLSFEGATELRLGPLSARAARELVDRVLGPGPPDDVREAIVTRAGGNAFYLEELIRAVAEGRSEELPATVLAMAQARLDALDPAERRMLRAASVLGRVSWPRALAEIAGEDLAMVDATLDALRARELLEVRDRSSVAGERELAIRHDLVREAAYASWTDEGREAAHRHAARWLEAHADVDPLVLAGHFDRGALPAQARAAYRRSAELALFAGDFRAVIERASRARALGAEGEERAVLGLLESEACRWRGAHVRGRELAEDAMSALAEGSAPWFRAVSEAMTASGRMGDYAASARFAALAMQVRASASADEVAQIRCLCAAGRQLFHGGEYAEAACAEARVAELAPDPDALDPVVAAEVHGLAAASARHRGDLAGDLDGYRRVWASAERAGDARTAVNTRVSVAFAFMQLGGFEHAALELEQALADAERMELESVATRARQNLALARMHLGDVEGAATLVDRVIAESRAQGNVRFTGWTLVYRAEIALAAGNAKLALEAAREAAEGLRPSPPARAGALAVGARALVHEGRGAEARAGAAEAMDVLRALGGIEEFESLVRLAWAESLDACGELDARAAAIDEARARLLERAAAIGEPRWRESFLVQVPENARTLALAAAWCGEQS